MHAIGESPVSTAHAGVLSLKRDINILDPYLGKSY